ncbi:ROK family transcriptional regulator [Microbacterium sp. NPDC076895]|uniref:ROK family transcriptional regulator n=1 Tax=Microbacterium sp. NPDC076895 TaxID=3154957 RepID=UPI0034405EC9
MKSLPQDARERNRSLVLQKLFRRGAMSRADLARETGLTRVTMSELVASLIDDHYVHEVGISELRRPGKPAVLVDIARDGHRIVAIDLSGASMLAGAVLSLDGDVLTRLRVPLPERSTEVLTATIALAQRLIASCDVPVLGLGVGSPGIIDDRGVVLAAPNIGWGGMELQSRLSDALAVPVLVANDANAAVLAERTFGGSQDDVVVVRVGSGLGAGLLTGGRPLRGGRYAAGEIGHVTVDGEGAPRCACGKVGCLEAWLSVPALHGRLGSSSSEQEKVAVLHQAGERLGTALAPVVAALDLAEIVLSGPPDLLGGVFARATVDTLRARTLAPFHDDVSVRLSEQGDDIVLRGAAVMVLSSVLGVS